MTVGCAAVLDGGFVGRVDLDRIVAAALQRPDLVVGPILDERLRLRIAAEELLAHVLAVARLERLIVAVDALVHQLHEPPARVGVEQRIPAAAPDDLDDVPAGAVEDALEFLNDLAVAAHRTVEPLQVAVDDPDQIVELLAAGERDRAERFGLVDLAVADERPHLASGRVAKPRSCRYLMKRA